jgi:hypothetical protein
MEENDMNITKAPCLAFIRAHTDTLAHPQKVAGNVVSVLRRAPTSKFQFPDGGQWYRANPIPRWFVEFDRPVSSPWNKILACVHVVMDAHLIQINGDDIPEDTTTDEPIKELA